MEARHSRGTTVLEHSVLALAAAALTGVAWRIYPAWDDGWLWLQGLEGAATIRESMADRPFLGGVWTVLAEAGLLLPVSAAAHWLGWLGLALVTRALWRRSFPRQASLGVVAAILTLSTVVLELHHVLVNPVWGGLVGVVLVWGSALWLTQGGSPVRAPSSIQAIGAAVAVGTACLLSEYGVVAAGVVVVLLLVQGSMSPARSARRRSALIIVGAAVSGYAVLLLASDPTMRPDARPGGLVDISLERVLATPFVVLTELWQGMFGNLLRRAGELEAESLESLTIVTFGALVAAGTAFLVGRDAGGQMDASAPPRAATALLAASAAGLLVMALASRVPWSGPSSRYYLPVAPPLACLAVWLALRLGAPRRAAAAAITFVAVFGTVQDLAELNAERLRIAEVAPIVARHLDRRGFTLVVLVQPEAIAVAQRASSHELTARIAQGLPRPLRRRLWAVRADALVAEGVEGVKLFAPVAPDARLERRVRGLGGHTAISRVLWIEMERRRGPVRVMVSETPRRRLVEDRR